jgi:hypothetical protein
VTSYCKTASEKTTMIAKPKERQSRNKKMNAVKIGLR